MSDLLTSVPEDKPMSLMPDEVVFRRGLAGRHLRGRVWKIFFMMAIVLALLSLVALFLNVVNSAAGLIVVQYNIDPAEVVPNGDLAAATAEQLAAGIVEYEPNRALVLIRDNLSSVPVDQFSASTMSQILGTHLYPESAADKTPRDLEPEERAAILAQNLSVDVMKQFISDDIIGLNVLETHSLFESIFDRAAIEEHFAAEFDPATTRLEFRLWLRPSFLTSGQSSDPVLAGIRTALIGTIWIVAITVLVAFPIGVGAAIYLEEYAAAFGNINTRFGRFMQWFNRFIETNVRNLAGVPSIIYGLLGLAIFVRAAAEFTSGRFVGVTDSNGRTIISASLTMALLILPVIIINAQEAIRAVQSSIREASYGLGATKWQTIWNQVLPAAMPGILTGTILGMSRAIGETAPLVIVGASTATFLDPNGPFSSFTALPIQIYQWTARPQAEFRAIAAAAIIVLLVLLLLLNATAILLRQYFRRKLQT